MIYDLQKLSGLQCMSESSFSVVEYLWRQISLLESRQITFFSVCMVLSFVIITV